MIFIPMIERIDSIMRGISQLVDKLTENESELVSNSIYLIKELEETADKYRLPIVPQLSVIRGKLICGAAKPAETISRKDMKALQKRYILSQLDELNKCVQGYLEDSRKIFSECERLACQVTVRLMAKGVLKEYDAANLSGDRLIKLASDDDELVPIVIHITGLIGAVNTNVIFDKTMSLAGL